jgi:hypothetical protein
MPKITRRQALVGGAGAVVVGGAGLSGRYAIGDTFESHVADQLGLPVGVTKELLESMRAEVGNYDARAAGFLTATTTPGKDLLPASVRRQAIESFVGPLIDIQTAFVTPQVYVGVKRDGRFSPCTGIGDPRGDAGS